MLYVGSTAACGGRLPVTEPAFGQYVPLAALPALKQRVKLVGRSLNNMGGMANSTPSPSDLYLKICAAIARDGQMNCTFHDGWPLLSLASDNSSVAEAGAVSSCPSGGLTT